MKKRLLITSALMTAVLGASLATGTYAWYQASGTATIKSVTANGTVSTPTATIDQGGEFELSLEAKEVASTTGKDLQLSSVEEGKYTHYYISQNGGAKVKYDGVAGATNVKVFAIVAKSKAQTIKDTPYSAEAVADVLNGGKAKVSVKKADGVEHDRTKFVLATTEIDPARVSEGEVNPNIESLSFDKEALVSADGQIIAYVSVRVEGDNEDNTHADTAAISSNFTVTIEAQAA